MENKKIKYCDNCNFKCNFNIEAVELNFNYGSKYDGDKYIFCSDKCLVGWIIDNKSELLK